jgi:hypothetical protein
VDEDVVAIEELQRQLLLRRDRRHLDDGVPPAVRRQKAEG